MESKNNIGIIIAHIAFWLLLFASPFYVNIKIFGLPIAIVRTVIPFIGIIILAYGNIWGIIPYLFKRKDFVWYKPFLAYVVIIPLSVISLEYIFEFVNYITNIRVSLVVEARQNGILVTPSGRSDSSFPLSIIGLMVVFTLFASSIYGLAMVFMQRDRQENLLKATNLKNELKLLRRQINPHFLFNAMNNLYAIVQLKPDKAGEFVLKLSDMLRYVTYDCQNEKVAISKEIDYIQNYIYFQQWRDQNFNNIQFNVEQGGNNLFIEPMLLLPFIENAFKHSYNNNHEERWVAIDLTMQNTTLSLIVKNSLSPMNTKENVPDEYMGIGIENVKKRLELLYYKKHQLNITQKEEAFEITLTIQLS